MTFHCEDLPDFGLILVPPSSPDYEPLLHDIQCRIENPPHQVLATRESFRTMLTGEIPERRPEYSAILLNQSAKPVVAIQLALTYDEVLERGEKLEERTSADSWRPLFSKALLLPFDASPSLLRPLGYWGVILPGSKRYLDRSEIAGDNTDARLPAPDEAWTAGGIEKFRGNGGPATPFLRSVTLVLDGVFFADGDFAGPNRHGLWETVTVEAEVRLEVAKIAFTGRNKGNEATDILEEIASFTGAAEKLTEVRKKELRQRAVEIDLSRRSIGDERTVQWLASHWHVPLPDFRKHWFHPAHTS